MATPCERCKELCILAQGVLCTYTYVSLSLPQADNRRRLTMRVEK